MSEQQHHVTSSQNDRLPWWIRLCRWLWKLSAFLGTSVFLALGVNVASTWLTTPKGALPADTPLSTSMTNWPISLLVGCCLFLLALIFWAISRWSLPSSSILAAITPRDREHMLKRLRLRYEQSLALYLQEAVQIELELASKPAAIQNALSHLLRQPEQPEQMLPPHTSIIDVYEQAQQELLILGEPGAGKSTLLLELTQYLVAQAEQYAVQPLPVLLPLSSWATKRLPLQEWLIEQFALLYDVPRQLSQNWVRTDLVLPLLDGLDEMDEAAQAACIAAINTYHREHLHPLVVCSRTNEYAAATLHERLALHTAVVVQPLAPEKVDTYLAAIGEPLTALRTVMKKNTKLQTLATTPLLLQILILTYHGVSIQAHSHKEGQLQKQIWSDYVQQMVSRKGNNTRYPLEQTCTWLGWLARQMRSQNITIFSLEQLPPDWLPKEQRIIHQWSIRLLGGLLGWLLFGLLGRLLGGLLGGLLGTLLGGQFDGLLVALFGGLLGWLIFGLLSGQLGWLLGWLLGGLFGGLLGTLLGTLLGGLNKIMEPAKTLTWSWKGLRDGQLFGPLGRLLVRLLFGLLFGLLGGLLFVLNFGQLGGLLGWLLVVLLGTLVGGLVGGLLVALLGALLGWLLGALPVGLLSALLFGLLVGYLVDYLVAPSLGLLTVVQYCTLRFWLWRSHLFPLKAVPFLEDATARILLRRIGGGYSFTHRLLLDYFADLETTPPAPSQDQNFTPVNQRGHSSWLGKIPSRE